MKMVFKGPNIFLKKKENSRREPKRSRGLEPHRGPKKLGFPLKTL